MRTNPMKSSPLLVILLIALVAISLACTARRTVEQVPESAPAEVAGTVPAEETIAPVEETAEAAEPTAEEVLAAYIEATGGKEAYESIYNRMSVTSMEMPAQGMTMKITSYIAKPNKAYTTIDTGVMGTVETGTDGEIVWQKSMMTGPRILKGPEREEVLRDSVLDRLVYWQDHFKTVEYAGLEDVKGKPAYKIVMTPLSGTDQTMFFDRESKLMVKLAMTVENPMGTIPLEIFSEDYREVDGILVAHKASMTMMGVETTMLVEEIRNNVDVPEGTFDLPAEIEALIETDAE